MPALGDYRTGKTIDFTFTTVTTTGAPTQLAGTPAISVYKTNSTTQTTTGVTLTVDFDGVTGLNHVRIDTSADGTFYAAGGDFHVVITTGTVGGTSVVGYTVATFSLENRSPLMPTTDGRKLTIEADGMAHADVKEWLGVAPAAYSTTRGTAGTALPAAAADAAGGLPISDAGGLDLDAKLANTNEVTAARMGALTDWINGGRLDLILDDILLDTAEIGAAGAGLTNINLPNQTMDIIGNITGSLSGSVGSVTGAVGSVTGNVGGNVTGTVGGFTAGAKAEIESEVNDALVAYDPPTHAELVSEINSVQSDIAGVPSAATVASAVRTELTTELARVDAAVSTRATPAQVNAEVLDVVNVDTLVAGKTIAAALKIAGGMVGGIVSGAGTGTEVFRDFAGNVAVTITVDSVGNRTAVVYA